MLTCCFVDFIRVRTNRACQRIDNQVEFLAELLYLVNNHFSGFVAECVCAECFCNKTFFLCSAVKRSIVVPARRSAFCFRRCFFKRNADCISTVLKRRRNTACKSVACRTAENKNSLRTFSALFYALDSALCFLSLYVFNLALCVTCASNRMSIQAHIASNHRFNNHNFTPIKNLFFIFLYIFSKSGRHCDRRNQANSLQQHSLRSLRRH